MISGNKAAFQASLISKQRNLETVTFGGKDTRYKARELFSAMDD